MALKFARPDGVNPSVVHLAEALAGAATTDVADRGTSHKVNATVVRICAGAGATPTCTYAIQVSADNSNWVQATFADSATPTVDVTATFALTSDTTVKKIVKHAQVWRYIRVVTTANTNVTNWIDVLYNDGDAWV